MKKGWKWQPLGDVCKTGSGGTPLKDRKEYYEGGTIPWLMSGEVSQGEVTQATKFITQLGLDNSAAKIFPENTVLVAMYGATAGQVGILRFKAATNQAVCGIYPNETFLPEFLFYFLLSKKDDLVAQATGNAQPNISQVKIKNTEVPVLPLSEQQRIVGLLDEAFAGLSTAQANAARNLQNARALFESHLQSVFAHKRWKITALGDLCTGVEYGSSAKSKKEGKIPVLRMGNIQGGRFDWKDLVYTDDKEEIERYTLRHNDVLFNRTNSPELVGKTAIYKGERPAIFAGYLIRIHRKPELLDADYLNYFLNSRIAFDYGKTVVISSVNQANINGAKLKTYPIPTPPLSDQKRIVTQLDALAVETQRLTRLYEQKQVALLELKKSLLHQAFTGEL